MGAFVGTVIALIPRERCRAKVTFLLKLLLAQPRIGRQGSAMSPHRVPQHSTRRRDFVSILGGGGGVELYCAVMPPSNVRTVPVAKRLSSLARNRIPAAISSGVPSLPRSWRAASALRVAAGSALVLRISLKYGVSIDP